MNNTKNRRVGPLKKMSLLGLAETENLIVRNELSAVLEVLRRQRGISPEQYDEIKMNHIL